MITLYGFGPTLGMPDPSPFVLRIDLFLRMTRLEYTYVGKADNIQRAPKNRLPFIRDGSAIIADSHFIINHLKQQYQVDPDDWLDEKQNAIAHLINTSLSDHFYWCLTHSRWVQDNTWPKIKKAYFKGTPFPINLFLPEMVRRDVVKSCKQQGIGAHSDEEIDFLAKESLSALSLILGDKTWLLGDRPATVDATAYGFLAQMILIQLDNPMNHMARSFNNLVAYCERVRDRYYSI